MAYTRYFGAEVAGATALRKSMDLYIMWRTDEEPTEAVTSMPPAVFFASCFDDRGDDGACEGEGELGGDADPDVCL